MEMKKTYYKHLDILRVVSFLAVLLYHLNLLPGGYLAVCSFFVLSGYLSVISAFQKEHFSLLHYYKSRLLKIYLPLVIVVFLTIAVLSFFPTITWLNLKPETTSVLLGYNNFWQLSANLDYFAHHISSPLMHLWYIAILLQFDLIFPFLYLGLKKIGEKLGKIVPCILLVLLSLTAAAYFVFASFQQPMMSTYYGTLTRIFSLLFGVLIGFLHSYYDVLVPKRFQGKIWSHIIFGLYFLILLVLFCFVSANSSYFQAFMILVTLLTCRLIDYSRVLSEVSTKENRLLKSLASVSYVAYLIQYPLIFLAPYFITNPYVQDITVILCLIPLAYLLHFALSKGKLQILRYLVLTLFLCGAGFGGYQYVIAEDHTQEMKALEEQLAQNEMMMAKKQEAYEQNRKKQEEELSKALQELGNDEENLREVILQLPVVGVGDSVMLGATPDLYEMFPNGYFDAKISRTAWVVNGILKSLKSSNLLGNPIIINVGANGDCNEACKQEIIDTCGEADVFWINVTNDRDVHVNANLQVLASKNENMYIVDWNSISNGHSEYFVADGIHLTDTGIVAYVDAIYQAIYQVYQARYTQMKEELIKKQEAFNESKVSFYGNDLLLNVLGEIEDPASRATFIANKEFTFKTLLDAIDEALENGQLNHKVVFVFDQNLTFSKEEYQELIGRLADYEVTFVILNSSDSKILSSVSSEKTKEIDFAQELEAHEEYLMVDKIHLTQDGNQALGRLLNALIQG